MLVFDRAWIERLGKYSNNFPEKKHGSLHKFSLTYHIQEQQSLISRNISISNKI